MQLEKAQLIANQVVDKLKPFCDRIEIAGSIRRRYPVVHDIDIVAIPNNMGHFAYWLAQFGKLKMSGPKIMRVGMGFTMGIDLDVYIATEDTWTTLLLIRTGSKEHNIRMCMRAQNKGMKLHADGTGLFRLVGCDGTEERIAGDTERSIFESLGLKYEEPWEREQ
jgi:DNA polymerase (family 10)